jgi:hypothetical protein
MTDGNIVSQNVETQTVIDNNITIQVTQEVQEQITIGVPGPRGPAGSINWLGAYNALTPYVDGDSVSYNGSSWICLVACTGITPIEGVNWSIIAAAGGAIGNIDGGIWPI